MYLDFLGYSYVGLMDSMHQVLLAIGTGFKTWSGYSHTSGNKCFYLLYVRGVCLAAMPGASHANSRKVQLLETYSEVNGLAGHPDSTS